MNFKRPPGTFDINVRQGSVVRTLESAIMIEWRFIKFSDTTCNRSEPDI